MMKRAALKLLIFTAALVCVGSGGLWIRSHMVRDELRISGGRRVDLIASHGVVLIEIESKFAGQTGNYNYRKIAPGDRLWLGDPSGVRIETFHASARDTDPLPTGPLGFSFSHDDRTCGEGLLRSVRFVNWTFSAPLGLCATGAALVAMVAIHRLRKTSRQDGRCDRCGYDLRATPDRCPECGATVNAGDCAAP